VDAGRPLRTAGQASSGALKQATSFQNVSHIPKKELMP
jgi:hypothetical protein